MRIASSSAVFLLRSSYLCLSVLHADCINLGAGIDLTVRTLSQRAPCGLHSPIGYIGRWSRNFVSACSMRIAFMLRLESDARESTLSQRAPCGLHHTAQPLRTSRLFFVSACSMRIASITQHPEYMKVIKLCLSVLHADCIMAIAVNALSAMPLSQRAPCGLHRLNSQLFRDVCGFVSACSMRIASSKRSRQWRRDYLCLSVLHADCISKNARMSIRYAVEYAVSR